ncbi:MAG TPA: hypothetical protein VGQ85_02480 [Candidatus Limnocylindrales bacterium]|nr:hypothetical protein [Candidatus Limnocylindrales bacterium]
MTFINFEGSLAETKPGLARYWSEFQTSFAEPFRSYGKQEFAKRPQATS